MQRGLKINRFYCYCRQYLEQLNTYYFTYSNCNQQYQENRFKLQLWSELMNKYLQNQILNPRIIIVGDLNITVVSWMADKKHTLFYQGYNLGIKRQHSKYPCWKSPRHWQESTKQISNIKKKYHSKTNGKIRKAITYKNYDSEKSNLNRFYNIQFKNKIIQNIIIIILKQVTLPIIGYLLSALKKFFPNFNLTAIQIIYHNLTPNIKRKLQKILGKNLNHFMQCHRVYQIKLLKVQLKIQIIISNLAIGFDQKTRCPQNCRIKLLISTISKTNQTKHLCIQKINESPENNVWITMF